MDRSIPRFEQYYPGQNVYFVQTVRGAAAEHVRTAPFVLAGDIMSAALRRRVLDKLKGAERVHLMVHYLTPLRALTARWLLRQIEVPTVSYWIFYGDDLYGDLFRRGRYQLHDRGEVGATFSWRFRNYHRLHAVYHALRRGRWLPAELKAFIGALDYFCFWNPFDFELLKQHYPTRAQFRPFRYLTDDLQVDKPIAPPRPGTVLINHSASHTGNHRTVLRKLHASPHQHLIERVVTPLSYGAAHVRARTIETGNALFGERFMPLLEFTSSERYFATLDEVSAGFFGHRRQEGGGSVSYLLGRGARVYLRPQNNLLDYLRWRGYHVFDLETDLERTDAFAPLPPEQAAHNARLVREEYGSVSADHIYHHLLDT